MYANLPDEIQQRAKRAYQLFRQNPSHPGLSFKKVDEENNIYSARVGLGYRVLGQIDDGDIVWFWIGPHTEYDRLLRA
jgi:mRNA-degrading endonuclease RelE of RelBE toxin-antitoxin system